MLETLGDMQGEVGASDNEARLRSAIDCIPQVRQRLRALVAVAAVLVLEIENPPDGGAALWVFEVPER